MAVLRFIQELLGIRPGITKGPQSRNVKKDVESERQHFLGADSGQCRGEDSGKPLAAGKGDGEILAWVLENSKTPRGPWEVEAWSAYFDKRSADSDAETLAGFAEYVGQHSKTREDIKSWFDALDLDDYVSFGGKA
jgi:uncharacterized protein DUF5069